jgi:PAS domain S-box-containing protein
MKQIDMQGNTKEAYLSRYDVFIIGVILAIVYWIIETILHIFLFHERMVFQALFPLQANELSMRITISGLFIIFGFYMQIQINKRITAENELVVYKNHLEEIVGEKTSNIKEINEQLSMEIKERRRNEEIIVRERNFSHSIINSSVDGIIAFDRHYRIILWNPGMEYISGLHHQEVIGKCIFDVFPFMKQSCEDKYLALVLEGRTIAVKDRLYTVPKSSKEGMYEGHYSPLYDENDIIVGGLGIISDITHQKNLEKELRESLNKMKNIDRMRNEFVDVAAHELRTPISSIGVYNQLMMCGKLGSFSGKEQTYLEDINSNLDELNKLIKEMLDFTHTESDIMKILPGIHDIKNIAHTIIERFKLVADTRNISISLKSSGETTVKLDPQLMEKVFSNLIGNAVKYSDDGNRIEINLKNNGEFIGVSVKDNGIGIPKNDIPHIFERFYMGDTSLTRNRDRLGFGLPIAKSIVERHGGSIWVESEVGKGSTFYINQGKL